MGFVLVDRDAGDVVGDVGDGEQALVFDALLGDDGHRLRRVAQRHVQWRGGAGAADGVRADSVAQLLGLHLHLRHRRGARVGGLGLGNEREREAHAQCQCFHVKTPGRADQLIHRCFLLFVIGT